jgi:hypothetical protein
MNWKHNVAGKTIMRRLWVIGLVLFLMACNSTLPAVTPILSPTLLPSRAFTSTVSITPSPFPTDTPTAALTELPILSFAPGLVAVEHADIQDFVFLVDPLQWELKPISNYQSQEQLNFLRHHDMPYCELRAPHIGGISSPDWFYYKILGDHDFVVYDYVTETLYGTYSLITKNMQFFELYGTEVAGCRTALETILTDMVEAAVYYGRAAPVSLTTATPRPPLEGYVCKSLPPRLRVGDYAYVIADAVWFRNAPSLSEDTQSRILTKYAPYISEIKDGPVCVDDYTFWAVNVYKIGEGEDELWSGWISEANTTDYLLEALR